MSALERLRLDVPEIHVLLTGPARGYVRGELERLGIPYRHVLARTRVQLGRRLSRARRVPRNVQTGGGCKAVLEAIATGVPLVTTRVGQAQELVDHGRNGLLVDVEDPEVCGSGCPPTRRCCPRNILPGGGPCDRRAVRPRVSGRRVSGASRGVRRSWRLTARGSSATRMRVRAKRDFSPRVERTRDFASATSTTASPPPVIPLPEVPPRYSGSRSVSRARRPTSRCSTSARASYHAISGHSCGSRAGGAPRSS